jgi:hypothetical protein
MKGLLESTLKVLDTIGLRHGMEDQEIKYCYNNCISFVQGLIVGTIVFTVVEYLMHDMHNTEILGGIMGNPNEL